MCKKCMLVISCIILVAFISFAKEVVISGTFIDTVLETGTGLDPILKIVPLRERSIAILSRCTEEPYSKYFAKTNNAGVFSVTINLPETCIYGSHAIIVACTTCNFQSIYTPPQDSQYEQIRVNFVQQKEYVRKIVPVVSYEHSVAFTKTRQIRGGDTLTIIARTRAIADNPDTVKYPECGSVIQLTTSTGTVVKEELIGCNYPSFTYISRKNSYFDENLTIVIPENLHLIYPDFKSDRTLKILRKMNSGEQTEPYSFTVVDSDIKVVDVTSTGTESYQKYKVKDDIANISIKADKVFFDISKSGNYSAGLFSADGRLIQSLAKNQHFGPGKHTFIMNKCNSSQMVILRLKSDEVTMSTILLR
ncbi:MAG: hypothetical protein JW915_10260 [Chitinispirillaceae bacterium]|nr:hypothetical protein [Chitinispirillaceae bacterium]